jgi:hypothetical protein
LMHASSADESRATDRYAYSEHDMWNNAQALVRLTQ